MFKHIFIVFSACALVITLTACRNNEETEDVSDDYTEEYSEVHAPTPEDLRAQFETFFEENKDQIIQSIATDGEEIRLELANGYEFIMTIILDDIELDDENRALYTLTFELSFAQMTDLFGALAQEIKEAAEINRFRLSVVFVDINEEEIARSSFDADMPLSDEISLEYEMNSDEETDE